MFIPITLGWNSFINGMEQIRSVFAGVGTPIKELVCRVSILNFANRMQEKIVIKNGIYST